eukprot:PITA_30625
MGRLLGFVVSKAGICVDPSKVEAIIKLPPPSSLRQLQSLQGKANFLRRFIPNYAEITKGFTRLLKQNTSFFWDEIAEKSFGALKHALTHAPLLHPPNYNQDYFLHLATSYSTIRMVLVQEDEFSTEHVIYYLSRTLNPTELKYSHVEKLPLAAVQAVQRFHHYILLRHLGLRHDSSTPYYPQANGLVEAINKFLVIMIQRIIGIHRSNWHNMLFSVLWVYQTSVKTSTGFTPFQLVYGLEVVLPIECEIPSF